MKYTLIRSSRKSLAVQIKDAELIVRAPLKMPVKQIEAFISEHRDWIERKLCESKLNAEKADDAGHLTQDDINKLADEALRIIPERVRHYADIIGVDYGRITIRCQRTKWGSCSSKGNLNFNCLLMLAPPEVLDSVIVHELCHRKEMNHSPRFYELVYKALPDYKKHHSWLKDNGQMLMNRVK